MSRNPVLALVALGAATALAGACAPGPSTISGAQDKVGTQTLTLHIASPDVVNTNGKSFGTEAFVDDLATVSGGQIKVDLIEHYASSGADAETQLIKALQTGEVDGSWPSARAFANAGIPALEALEAPMTITSYAAEKALVSGTVAADVLDRLKGTGLVGLALLVGPLRRPFAAQGPLLAPVDWKGITFRTFNSPLQSSAIEALGGTPVEAGADWGSEVQAGTLRGVEFDVAQYAIDNHSEAPFVTSNVVLWPKVFVLAMSQKRWDALSDQQRAWVQQAADMARAASLAGSYDESVQATQLCDAGTRFLDASSEQLDAMRKALAPVVAKLAQDPATSSLLAEVQGVAAQNPGIDEPSVPDSCRTTATLTPSPTIPATAASLPNGTYRVRITDADITAAGLADFTNQGTWTLTVKPGVFSLSCRPVSNPDEDCGTGNPQGATVEVGHLYGSGQQVYFVGDVDMLHQANGCVLPVSQAAGHCVLIPPYWFTWALAGDQLTFSDPGGQPSQQYVIRPWSKIN